MDMAVNPLLDRYPLVKLAFIVSSRGLLPTFLSFILVFHPPKQTSSLSVLTCSYAEVDKMDSTAGLFFADFSERTASQVRVENRFASVLNVNAVFVYFDCAGAIFTAPPSLACTAARLLVLAAALALASGAMCLQRRS